MPILPAKKYSTGKIHIKYQRRIPFLESSVFHRLFLYSPDSFFDAKSGAHILSSRSPTALNINETTNTKGLWHLSSDREAADSAGGQVCTQLVNAEKAS